MLGRKFTSGLRRRQITRVRRCAAPRRHAEAEPLEPRQLLTTYTVTNTSDSGAGSLRQAITDSNGDTAATNTIQFNIPTSDPGFEFGDEYVISPATNLPTITQAVDIDGTTQSGYAGVPIVDLSGDGAMVGLHINCSSCTVRGLAVSNFDTGIYLDGDTNTTIAGNYIGYDKAAILPPNITGILLNVSQGDTIGGTTAADRNVITNNEFADVQVNAGSGDVIEGNDIGANFISTSDLLSAPTGVLVSDGAEQITIGGATPGAGNEIVGCNTGIHIIGVAPLCSVLGNLIGTDAAGDASLDNYTGVLADASSQSVIGGVSPGDGNVISGNVYGITIINGSSNLVQGNLIGTNPQGTGPLGNQGDGVVVGAFSTPPNDAIDNIIGGGTAAAANVIAYNGGAGVLLGSVGNVVDNPIRLNSIFGNGRPGIDLNGDGPTPNDPGDADTGANDLQNFPVLASASSDGTTMTVSGGLNSNASTPFIIDFYTNTALDSDNSTVQGKTYVGSAFVSTDSAGNATINVTLPVGIAAGTYLTATATTADNAPYGDTSEFAYPVTVQSAPPPGGGGGGGSTLPTLSIANVSQYEGNTGATTFTFVVTLSAPASSLVSVYAVTYDGTATVADNDYLATAQVLEFAPGDTSAYVNVSVTGDTKFENDETFKVQLFAPTGAGFAGSSIATGTILNDDAAPVVTIGNASASVPAGGSALLSFPVTLTGSTALPATVQFNTLDGTAKISGGDYDPASGTLTFAPGVTTQNITITANADAALHPSASFFVQLSNPTNATISGGTGTGTIQEPAPTPPPPPSTTGNISGAVLGGPGAGETIYLDGNNNSALDPGELSTTTAAGGAFSFSDVPIGAYIIRQVLPAGVVQISPSHNYGLHINVAAGSNLTGENFTNVPLNGGVISGTVSGGKAGQTIYLDANNNSHQDAAELWTTTDSSGYYQFTNVPPGPLIIRQVLPAGYTQVSPSHNYGLHITVAPGEVLPNQNFADVGPASIAGSVFLDSNSNGSRDSGETGLAGWTVYIDSNNDGVLDNGEQSTLTDVNGDYLLGNLAAGTYIVRAIRPNGYAQTSPANGFGQHVTLAAGQAAAGKSFGERHTV